jgi:hypothetical protein
MGRKGEEGGRFTGPRPPGEARRPGDGPGWLDPDAGRPLGRPDPFSRRPPLGPKGYHRPDERIRDEVCERIARSGIDARDVEVAVEAGEVTLTGTVERRDDKRALEDVADDVFGVEDVHNRIRLRRSRFARPREVAAAPAAERPPEATAPATPADPTPPRPRGRRRRDPGGTH